MITNSGNSPKFQIWYAILGAFSHHTFKKRLDLRICGGRKTIRRKGTGGHFLAKIAIRSIRYVQFVSF